MSMSEEDKRDLAVGLVSAALSDSDEKNSEQSQQKQKDNPRRQKEKKRKRKIRRGKMLIGMGKTIRATGKGVSLSGKGMKAAGKALAAAGKAIEKAAQAIRKAGQAVMRSGMAMIKAGAAACSTVVGAIAGVPMIAAGSVMVAAGAATMAASIPVTMSGIAMRAAGNGMQKIGNVIEKLGRAIQKPGINLQRRGQEICRSAGKEVSIDIPQQSNESSNDNSSEKTENLAAGMAEALLYAQESNSTREQNASGQKRSNSDSRGMHSMSPIQNTADERTSVSNSSIEIATDAKITNLENVHTLASKTGRTSLAASSSRQIRSHISRTQGREAFAAYKKANQDKYPEWRPCPKVRQTTMSPEILRMGYGMGGLGA